MSGCGDMTWRRKKRTVKCDVCKTKYIQQSSAESHVVLTAMCLCQGHALLQIKEEFDTAS